MLGEIVGASFDSRQSAVSGIAKVLVIGANSIVVTGVRDIAAAVSIPARAVRINRPHNLPGYLAFETEGFGLWEGT